MLKDPKAIEIISNAQQKNVQNPNRSRAHFDSIFEDFFFENDFQGSNVLDIGPGQYDFGELSKQRGAISHAIDKDPAVLELGVYLGHQVHNLDLRKLTSSSLPIKYDGIFCKLSLNAFWFSKPDKLEYSVNQLCNLINSENEKAWGWIAPWNGIPKARSQDIESDLIFLNEMFEVQVSTFAQHGFQCYELEREQAARYGVTGVTFNTPLFIRNLPIPESLSDNLIR